MPWNSPSMISGLQSYFESISANDVDEAADKIAELYAASAITVQPTIFFTVPLALNDASIIAQGFSTSFKAARELKDNISADVWLPAASAIVAFWVDVMLNPLVPPPGGTLGVTNTVLVPGLPSPLNTDISDAFSVTDDPLLTATKLNAAFLNHLSTVTGLWAGFAPGLPPIPFPFPWVGLS